MPPNIPQSAKTEAALAPGAKVDHYSIIRQLGAGGMAEVYLAQDTMLGRKIALKIIHPKRVEKQNALRRFLFEAKATTRFSHPNIVTIYGAGLCAKGPYLALEYVEGQTLRERLLQERLSLKEAIRIGHSIAVAYPMQNLVLLRKKSLCPRESSQSTFQHGSFVGAHTQRIQA